MFRGELKAGDHLLGFGDVTYIVGVINLSPESKNLHTVAATPEEAEDLAGRYVDWGADIIEVGGQSSHFSNPTLEVQEEIDRVVPAVARLADRGLVVAVDTWKPEVARAALAAGASIINDTGGMRDPAMRAVVEDSSAAVVAVAVDGENPHAIDEGSRARDATSNRAYFTDLLGRLSPGMASRTIIDPGIAINYQGDYEQYTRLQLDVIRNSGSFADLGRPLLIPIPRKADIYWVAAYITLALEYGADMIRVHDVAVAARLRQLWDRRP